MSITLLKKDFDLNSIKIKTDDEFKHLRDFLNDNANQYIKHKLCSIYGYFLSEKIVGYITISTTSLKIRDKHLESLEGMMIGLEGINFPIPCILIGKLLVDKDSQNNGIGRDLLLYIMSYCYELSFSIGVRFIYIDSNKNTVNFYEKYGFVSIEEKKNTVSMVFDLNLYEN